MYVTFKMDGKMDNNQIVGVGKFKCRMLLDKPKEVFEEKLMNEKIIIINDHILKINKLEKIEYSNEKHQQEVSYILPMGASIKKKTLLQKLKSLYFDKRA